MIPPRAARPVIAAVCLAALALPLSFTSGAVATRAIGRELGGDGAALAWITNAFMLAFGGLLMVAGALADRYGRRRVFASGVAGFAAASLALALAQSIATLDLLRAVQGAAAAAALAGGSAALAQEVEGRARTIAFSLLGATFGLGLSCGPVLAGLLVETAGWRSVFLPGAVLGALGLALGLGAMPETRDPSAARLDLPGALTFTLALALFTVGLIEAPSLGWSSPVAAGSLLASAALMWLFARIELSAPRPMLDLTLFRAPRFAGVQLLPVATCFCFVTLLVLLPTRLIGVEGASETEAGLLMICLSAPALLAPLPAAALTRWLSPRALCVSGLLIAAAGLVWLALAPAEGSIWRLAAPMTLIGAGAGLPWGLMDGLAISVAPTERAGMAAGVFNTVRVAGEGVALAVVNAAMTALLANALAGEGLAPAAAARTAARLAVGDLAAARTLHPAVAGAALQDAYARSFDQLLLALALLTAVSAAAVHVFLSGDRRAAADGDKERPAS